MERQGERKDAPDGSPHPQASVKPLKHGPTSQNIDPQETNQKPEDLLEEESMESFPASDPPSHTPAHS